MTETNTSPLVATPLSRMGRIRARIVAWLVRALHSTWFVGRRTEGGDSWHLRADQPVVYVFWHGQQMAMVGTHADRGIVGLASLSRDGSFLARVIRNLGYGVVRGSSSRGGPEAIEQCVRELRAGRSVGIAIDGPRGPRYTARIGAFVMASRARCPIVWVVCARRRCLRLRSWDRFEIPWPWSRIEVVYGEIPAPEPERTAVEAARVRVETSMRDACPD